MVCTLLVEKVVGLHNLTILLQIFEDIWTRSTYHVQNILVPLNKCLERYAVHYVHSVVFWYMRFAYLQVQHNPRICNPNPPVGLYYCTSVDHFMHDDKTSRGSVCASGRQRYNEISTPHLRRPLNLSSCFIIINNKLYYPTL